MSKNDIGRKMPAFFAMISLSLVIFCIESRAEEKILYDFEDKNEACWAVPEWCFEKKDYVCKSTAIIEDAASRGKSSMKLAVDFPGGIWRAAIAECEMPLSLIDYDAISCDFYITKGASRGIRAKLILTASATSEWTWNETVSSVALVPGQWVTLSASLKPNSKDWMQPLSFVIPGRTEYDPRVTGATIVKMTDDFKSSVEKIGVRLESDDAAYRGDVYIDNVKLSRKEAK